jgi:hypothetical protein
MRKGQHLACGLAGQVLCVCAFVAASPAFACFTVLGPSDEQVYHGPDAPVDMSRPIHETLPSVFPGGHLVFDLASCGPGEKDLRGLARVRSVSSEDVVVLRTVSAPAGAVPRGIAGVPVDTSQAAVVSSAAAGAQTPRN